MSEPRDQNRFLVRMPDGMRDRIRNAAEGNHRSMNAEIVARLETTFEEGTEASLRAHIEAHEAKLAIDREEINEMRDTLAFLKEAGALIRSGKAATVLEVLQKLQDEKSGRK